MAELKTKPNDGNVLEFIHSVENQRRRADALVLLDMMQEVTGDMPVMWGSSIIGFGSYRYKYASGRKGDWFVAGFSPRKQSMTIYIMGGYAKLDEHLSRLGKHKTSKGCLYINKLDDVDLDVLRDLISATVAYLRNKHIPTNPGPADRNS